MLRILPAAEPGDFHMLRESDFQPADVPRAKSGEQYHGKSRFHPFGSALRQKVFHRPVQPLCRVRQARYQL